MIDYLSQVKPLEDNGLSDAEIAYSIANQTAKPMSCAESKIVLEENGLVVEDPVTGQRSGSLIDHYKVMSDLTLKALAGWYISHVFGRGESVNSDTYPRSSQVAQVMASLPADMQPAADALIALGGGKPYAGTTGADVVASRDRYNAEQAEQEAEQEIQIAVDALELRYITQYNKNISPLIDARNITEADWVAAIQQMASEF
jgi:hypothetical protein